MVVFDEKNSLYFVRFGESFGAPGNKSFTLDLYAFLSSLLELFDVR